MYDLIIIGAGPAGLSAAIYAARYKVKTLVLYEMMGGVASEAPEVGNYAGFENITGIELTQKFKEQAQKCGAELKQEVVESIIKEEDGFKVIAEKEYKGKCLLFATGLRRRKLNLPNEDKFIGKGMSYCASCDAPLFKDKTVAVVGGANSAAECTLLTAKYSSKIYMIYRKDKLRAEPNLIEEIEKNPKIEVIYNANVVELKGENALEGAMLDNGKELKLQGLFVEIGGDPVGDLSASLGVELDEQKYIKVDASQKTNVDNVFAAGDISTNSNKFRQIATAVGEGAVAAFSVYKTLKN